MLKMLMARLCCCGTPSSSSSSVISSSSVPSSSPTPPVSTAESLTCGCDGNVAARRYQVDFSAYSFGTLCIQTHYLILQTLVLTGSFWDTTARAKNTSNFGAACPDGTTNWPLARLRCLPNPTNNTTVWTLILYENQSFVTTLAAYQSAVLPDPYDCLSGFSMTKISGDANWPNSIGVTVG